MENLNKELRELMSYPGHFCSKSIIESVLLQQEQGSDVCDNLRLYTLRTRSRKYNLEELPRTNNVKALHGLLCKPISVNITKLPASELQRVFEARDKMLKNKMEKRNETMTRNARIKQNEVSDRSHVTKNARFQTGSVRKTYNHNSDIKNLLKSIKQPYIKLHRIDEVISKIAQSFAKVISNKECGTSVCTSGTKETEPKSVDLVSEPSDVDTDACLEKNNTLTFDPDLDDTLRLNNTQSDTDESDIDINKNASKTVLGRKRKVLYDSDDNSSSDDNEGNNSRNVVFSRDTKVLKLNLPEKEIQDTDDVKIIEVIENTKDTKKMPVSETETTQNLCVSNELHNLLSEQNLRMKNVDVWHHNLSGTENVSSKSCHDNVNNTVNLVLSDVTCATEINDEDTRNEITESMILDKDLAAKYNLLKELRVYLIQLDHIKCSTRNRYSALEVEEQTRRYMRVLNNHKFAYQRLSLVDKEMEMERNNDRVGTVELVENTPVLNLNVRELSGNARIKAEISKDWETSDDSIGCPEKVFESTISNCSSPIKSITSEPSGVMRNMVQTGKSGDRSDSIAIDKKMRSPIVELPEHKTSPKRSSNNGTARSSDTIQADAYNIILSNKPVPSHNEKVVISGRKTFVTKIHANTVNIINPKVNTKKTMSTCRPIVSPTKHKKSADKKDNNKSVGYRCIVCDLCFENYSDLQHHLITHTQKQNNSVSPCSSKEFTPIRPKDHRETVLDSPKSRKAVRTTSASNARKKPKEQRNKFTSVRDLQEKKKYFSKQRSKFHNTLYQPSECTICSKIFPTATDLAAHIFLHTEHELQMAYEAAKRKNNVTEQTAKLSDGVEKTNLSNVVDEQQQVAIVQQYGSPSATQQPSRVTVVSTIPSTIATTAPLRNPVTIITDTLRTNESPVTSENNSNKLQTSSTRNKSETNKAKKSVKICICHDTTETDENRLKIEIALVCCTCKVLFRSMECFNEHYDLAAYEFCKENRVRSGRSPNLLCAACGITFPSVQDVRHHLESHALVQKNCRTDFRCKICKVVFVGIGALFYVHWSKHLQDPYWVADETTFPTNSVINPRSDQNKDTPSTSEETYVQVAEHICYVCKVPFVTDNELKKHKLKCKSSDDSDKSNTEKKPLEIEVNCTLCKHVFTERLAFYRHIRNKHNFIGEPQFVCVSLTLIKTAYICNICMEISESIEDFEDHWLKHSTAAVYFTCTYCTKAYRNDLNALLEHARTHQVNTKQYVLSCTVAYENSSFTCEHCSSSFQSEKALHDHTVTHEPKQAANSVKTATSNSEKNQISDASKSTELVGEKGKEGDTSRSMEQTNEVDPVEFGKDKDREKLISILEGNDDSEHDLIIDWREKSADENGPSKERSNKTQQASVGMPTVSESDTVNASTENVVEQASENNRASVSSETTVPSSETCTQDPKTSSADASDILVVLIQEDTSEAFKQSECSVVQNTEDNTCCGSAKDKGDPTVLKQNSPPKPRQGFLRVRSLAELTNRPTPVQVEENRIPKPSSSIVFHHPSVSGKRVTAAVSTSVTNNQQFKLKQPQGHVNTGQRVIQSSTSAYHKNLPTCNIARPTSAVPRYTQKGENASSPTTTTTTTITTTTTTTRTTATTADCSRTQNQRTNNVTNFTPQPSANTTNNTRNLNRPNSSVFSSQPSKANTNSSHKERRPVMKKTGYQNGNPTTASKAAVINSNQNPKQPNPSLPVISYQYPSFVASNSTNVNKTQQECQRIMVNPSGEASTIYYKNDNISNGGISIVINETTTAVPNMSTINIMGQEQQQPYQPQIYKDPIVVLDHSYAQQTQIANDFSPTNNVYHIVTSEYQVPNRDRHSTYKLHLPTPIFICSYCSDTVTFSSAEQLEVHLNGNHIFLCDVCGHRSYSFTELNNHKAMHNFN